MKNLLLASILLLAMPVDAAGSSNRQLSVITADQEKEYKKIEATDVPADILKAASAKYSGYALTESYASEDGEYKLVLAKDGKSVKAYYKATGEFLKEEA